MNRKTKIIGLFLVLVMMASLFMTACTKTTPPENTGTTTEEGTAPDAASLNPYHFGVILYGKEDTMCSTVYSNLNYAAGVLNSKITWAIGSFDATAQLTDAENLIAAGVQGILCLPMSEVATQKIAELCEQNNVKFGIIFRKISDPDIRAEVMGRSCYIGNSTGDDEGNAETMIEIVSKAGYSKVAVIFAQESSSGALRNVGFRNKMQALNMTQLAEATTPSDNLAAVTSTIQNFINTNSDLEAIILANGGGGIAETTYSTLLQMNSNVKLANFDIFEGGKEALENGTLIVEAGGQAPQALMMFIVMYNAVDGNPISAEPVSLLQKFIFVTSVAECDAYEQFIANSEYQIYDEEAILNMVARLNPDFKVADIIKLMEDYSIDNIIANS